MFRQIPHFPPLGLIHGATRDFRWQRWGFRAWLLLHSPPGAQGGQEPARLIHLGQECMVLGISGIAVRWSTSLGVEWVVRKRVD